MRALPFLISLGCMLQSFAQQRHCGTAERYEKAMQDPAVRGSYEALRQDAFNWAQAHGFSAADTSVYRIPVVVHVVYYHTSSEQNIAENQVLSQIYAINKDFRRTNSDTGNTAGAFLPIAADCKIQFQLANKTPQGNPTNGITWRSTVYDNIGALDDNIYYTDSGGEDIWDPECYYNIWVCKVDPGAVANDLGYTYLPGTIGPDKDGTVIDYRAFGTIGTAASPFHLGRTATHEAGHFLDLLHIWGPDGGCGADDGVGDTPPQASSNSSCPAFPKTDACTAASPGVMFMNYMDYTYDNCMNLFTEEQAARMRSVLNTHPLRIRLKDRTYCDVLAIEEEEPAYVASLYPNPSHGLITVKMAKSTGARIEVFNMLGQRVHVSEKQAGSGPAFALDLEGNPPGIYLLKFSGKEGSSTQKIILH